MDIHGKDAVRESGPTLQYRVNGPMINVKNVFGAEEISTSRKTPQQRFETQRHGDHRDETNQE